MISNVKKGTTCRSLPWYLFCDIFVSLYYFSQKFFYCNSRDKMLKVNKIFKENNHLYGIGIVIYLFILFIYLEGQYTSITINCNTIISMLSCISCNAIPHNIYIKKFVGVITILYYFLG